MTATPARQKMTVSGPLPVTSFNDRGPGAVMPESGDYMVGLGNVSNNLQLAQSNNGSDIASPPTFATNLGLGTGSSPTFAGLTVSGIATAEHFVGGGTKPTAATGSAMGSGGSLTAPTVVGTDVSFAVTLTTGLSTTAGTLFTITFANAFTVAPPAPTLTPGNLAAASQFITHNFLASATTTTVAVTCQTGLSSNTQYVFFLRP
jgi:hypothetical protein